MPIALDTVNWIPRAAEIQFKTLLDNKKTCVLPIIGGGGIGKTSLLRRFSNHCERHQIPVLYIDLPRLTTASMRDVLMQLEAKNTPSFDKQRKKLRTSYETLTAMLQSYGAHAGNAADLLQKSAGTDESFGLVGDTIKGTVKAAFTFMQREENKQHQTLLKKPEESLLRALADDFKSQGVILIDTLEQAGKQDLPTYLRYLDSGEIETIIAETPEPVTLLDHCAGLAAFLFDQPVIMVMAGRPPAITELGKLPAQYFTETIEVPTFTTDEISNYLGQSLPRQIDLPDEASIQQLLKLTHGNPFLLDRVVRLVIQRKQDWQWDDAHWQPFIDSFNRDEKHGLLLYVTDRLLTHALPDDSAFWRLAIPRQFIHRDMAEMLFSKDEFGVQAGLQRLRTYEDKGIIYQQQNPDYFYLHDETRAAFEAWAKRYDCWLDEPAADIHTLLAKWFDKQTGWPEKFPELDSEDVRPENGNLFLLEGAFHQLMADKTFEQHFVGHHRGLFWSLLCNAVYEHNAYKRFVIDDIVSMDKAEFAQLVNWLEEDRDFFSKSLQPEAVQWIKSLSYNGLLPPNWTENISFYEQACQRFPQDAVFLGGLANLLRNKSQDVERIESLFSQAIKLDSVNGTYLYQFADFITETKREYDQAETLYQQAIDLDPTDADCFGYFADFMVNIRKDFPMAKSLYQQAIDVEPENAMWLGSFADFYAEKGNNDDQAESLYLRATEADSTEPLCFVSFADFLTDNRQDYVRAEINYNKALEIAPMDKLILRSFAIFMENSCENYEQAGHLYQQAVNVDPEDPYSLSLLANFTATVRKDYDRAESLHQQAVEAGPKDADALGCFAAFMVEIREDYDRAESLYRQAIDVSPPDVDWLIDFSQFMLETREDHEEAESLYLQALDVEPMNTSVLLGFAEFITETLEDYDRAESFYLQALDVDPLDARMLGSVAEFVIDFRKDYDRAQVLYQQAIEIAPLDADLCGNFAEFMGEKRNNYDQAESLYLQAIKAAPMDAHWINRFAGFMAEIRQDFDRAKSLYQQAIDIEPTEADWLGDFANFLVDIRQDYDRTESLYQQAINAEPRNPVWSGQFAIFLQEIRKDYDRAEVFYNQFLAAELNDVNVLVNMAQIKLVKGQTESGKALLDQAFDLSPEPDVQLEMWFYRLAHFSQEYPQAQSQIKTLLDAGVRSEGWDFSRNIECAHQEGHQNIALLQRLADVISGKIL